MNNSDLTPNDNKKPSQMSFISLAFEMGFIIALPLLAFGLAGKYLDQRFETAPLLTLIGIILAISSTTLWMAKKIRSYQP